ncbi:MAG: electron transfer flavoprotein [Berryella intestinalis]|uniref:electron transfer flavoprotein n=1 Tax=Berryella intestinalis TaxID=1531429 RepID=UPI002A52115D|nr:electron transfer flavoprotein [Berryella intestinalis]MDD7368818.1 electron transfer flavoprotein [Berryella intestinalis]MDY3128934.1 electron transfer flavoprotein [Berryella intestinalis]
MNIVAAFKVVPDDQDIQVLEDGSLDYSKAKGVVSAYDLNALEFSARIAAETGGSVTAVSAGPVSIDDPKLKKNVLARGIDELIMAADDGYGDMDARATAAVLASLVERVAAFDLIVCGGGSADNYAQQVDVQLAAKMGLPVVNGVVKAEVRGSSLVVERVVEQAVETIEVPLPAVVSVLPDAAEPRIPGMKDILAAGKKPMSTVDAGSAVEGAIEVVSCKAPKGADRKLEVLDASDDGAIERFAAALKASL